MLSNMIVKKNEEGKEKYVNLKGFAVGNPLTVGNSNGSSISSNGNSSLYCVGLSFFD